MSDAKRAQRQYTRMSTTCNGGRSEFVSSSGSRTLPWCVNSHTKSFNVSYQVSPSQTVSALHPIKLKESLISQFTYKISYLYKLVAIWQLRIICGSSSVYVNGIIGIFQSLCTVYNFKIKTK